MKHFKYLRLAIASIATCYCWAFFCSCSLDIPIEDKIADPEAITDANSAEKALATAYSSYAYWQEMTTFDAMSDDVMPTPALTKNNELNIAYTWHIEGLVQLSANIWDNQYRTIMYVNALLDRIGLITPTTDDEKASIRDIDHQAKALKALCYLNLLHLYTPRYTEENKNKPGLIIKNHAHQETPKRTSIQASIDSIYSLLDPIINSKATSKKERNYRITPETARIVAAEAALWQQNYTKALQYCQPIIQQISRIKPSENFYVDFWSLMNQANPMAVFNLDYTPFAGIRFFDNWATTDGDALAVNQSIEFESTDARKKTTTPTTIDGRDVLLLGKYNALRKANQNIRFISIYRTTDALFIALECMVKLGQRAQAISLFNHYLTSVGCLPIEDMMKESDLLEKIWAEKQKEFLGEGKRLIDLKRLGLAPLYRYRIFDQGLNSIEANDFRWTLPIPPSEYRYNENIEQNPGWEKYLPKPQA